MYRYEYNDNEIWLIRFLLNEDMTTKEFKKCVEDRYIQCYNKSFFTKERDSVTDIEVEYNMECGKVEVCVPCPNNAWSYTDGEGGFPFCFCYDRDFNLPAS